jgi:hypothetical protein
LEFKSAIDASATGSVSQYLDAIPQALAAGKPVMMMETNTASCGGFPGLSDAFGSAMWGVDYALQMAAVNFSHAMFHVGGQSDYYNVGIFSIPSPR